MAMASSATAVPPSVPQVVVQLSLADDAVRQRWYSLVPSDSPVLLPLRQDSSNGVWNDVNGVAGTFAPLTVDGDPNGAVTGFSAAGVSESRQPGGNGDSEIQIRRVLYSLYLRAADTDDADRWPNPYSSRVTRTRTIYL